MVTTTDFPFATLAAWGAAVANPGHLLKQPPNFDSRTIALPGCLSRPKPPTTESTIASIAFTVD